MRTRPVLFGGRVTDVEGVPGNPKIFYVATATGGIWKTINAGTMFVPVFDKERVISMGEIVNVNLGPDDDEPKTAIDP